MLNIYIHVQVSGSKAPFVAIVTFSLLMAVHIDKLHSKLYSTFTLKSLVKTVNNFSELHAIIMRLPPIDSVQKYTSHT